MKQIYRLLYTLIVGGVLALTIVLPRIDIGQSNPGQSAENTQTASQLELPAPEEIPAEPRPASARTGQTLVKLPDQASIDQFLASNQLSPAELTPSGLSGTYLVGREPEALDTEGVEAFPNLKYQATLTPNDPQYSSQWHLPQIAAPAAWDTTTGSATVTIAVIDTGFALLHQDLSSKLTAAGTWRDFVCGDNSPQAGDVDCDAAPTNANASHGTVTAGTAAAATNNSAGVAGVGWDVRILPLQALADNGTGDTADVATAIEYAKTQGVKVISMSLGSTGVDNLLRQEIDEAIAAGITVVAAIGNCGDPATYIANGCDFVGQQLDPGRYTPVIGVGASNQSDQRASFSSYGSSVDLIAPGSSILSTSWSVTNQTTLYGSVSGTSLSTPIVAGAVGLLKSAHVSLSEGEVTAVLNGGVDKVAQMSGANYTNEHGFGRLNAQKVVTLAGVNCPVGIAAKWNQAAAPAGGKVISSRLSGETDNLALSFLNKTGTGCVEIHSWNHNQQAWLSNVASNHPATNPADSEIISGNTFGDQRSEMMLVKYRNTGSGRIEVHTWNSTQQTWIANVATNHPAIDPADADVIATDQNGDGRDELVFVKYRNTGSGKVEVHEWGPSLQNWVANLATSLDAVNPADARVVGTNLYGESANELVFVKYRNTGSGRIEAHTWAGGQQAWLSNVATNHGAVSPDDALVLGANMYDGAVDELVFVKYRNTGSGRIEAHTWAGGQQAWLSNVATNHPVLD